MSGQRVGWRPYTSPSANTVSTLLTSLYGAWNGDTTGTSLDASIFGAWNAEASNNITVKNAWNANGNVNDSKGTANGTIATPSGTTFVTGTMSFGTGKLGSGAFTFNGSNFISLPADTLSFTGDFSVSMWVYIPSLVSSTSYIALLSAFDNKTGYTTVFGWRLFYYNDKIQFRLGETYSTNPNSTEANMALKDQWVHIVATRKSSSLTTIYINGVQAAQTNNSVNPIYNSNNLAYIGASFYGFSQPYYSSLAPNGVKIDSIQTWETILDQTAVTELYNSGNGQEYPFTISNALIASPKDAVGTNHGTLMNGASFTTGKIGNAFTFDGVNDYVELPANSMNVTGDFTISFWANMRTRDYNNIICNMGNDGVNRGFYIDSDGSYALRFVGYNSGYTLVKTDNSVLFDMNVWNHYTFICKNGVGQWYKNGVANGSSGSIVYSLISGNKPIIGGYRTGNSGSVSSNKNMALDAITIWNKAITLDEITQLYNLGTGAQYPFSSQTLPSTNNQLGVDNATLMNGCTFGEGKIGKAFIFDGVNDFVKFPPGSMNFSGDFSISGWINLPGVYNGTKEVDILMNVTAPSWFSSPKGFWLGTSGNLVYFNIYNGTSSAGCSWDDSTGSIIKGNSGWIHIIATRKVSTGSKLYVNGVLKASNTSTLDPTYDSIYQTPSMGALYVLNSSGAVVNNSVFSPVGTKIDGLSVWQKELTQAEVTELYNSGAGKQITATPIVTNGLVLNLDASRTSSYPGSGTTWTDISGSGNNGTMVNGPVFGTASGGVITFDGVNDYVELGTNTSLNLINISISVWVKPTTTTDYIPIIGRYANTTSNNGWELYYLKSTNKFYFGGRESVSSYLQLMSNNTYSINNWYNITGVKSGNVWSLYVNGVLDNSLTLGSGTITFGTNSMQIGGELAGGMWYHGKSDISQSIIYNRALTATEITQNFNATKSRFGL